MNKNALAVAIATALSGFVSGLLITNTLQFGPGLFFGVITALLFSRFYGTKLKSLLWILASTASWYVALRVNFSLANYSFSTVQGNVFSSQSLLLAGGVGAILLAMSFSLLIKKMPPINLVITTIVGSALAVVFQLLPNPVELPFMIWQIGIGLSLANT